MPIRNISLRGVAVSVQLRHTVLYPGNILEGTVQLQLASITDCTAIRLKIVGKQRIYLVHQKIEKIPPPAPPPPRRCIGETSTSTSSFHSELPSYVTVNVPEVETNCVFKQLITIVGQMKTVAGGMRCQMGPGQYAFPFAVQLPMNVPPSFCEELGGDTGEDCAELMYHVKVTVDTSFGRDAKFYAPFRVLRPMPLQQHTLRAPVSKHETYDLSCCCCISKGTVTVKMHLDRSLIAIDRDNLFLQCDIDNTRGEEPVESLTVTLLNRIRYQVNGRVGYAAKDTATHFLHTAIRPGQCAQVAATVPLPRRCIPTVSTSNIESSYQIIVTLSVPWANDPMQAFDVVVAQSVDEANVSPCLPTQPSSTFAVPYVRLQKGQLSSHEVYYVPPPPPPPQHDGRAMEPALAYTAVPPQGAPVTIYPQAVPAAVALWLPPASWAMQGGGGSVSRHSMACDLPPVEAICLDDDPQDEIEREGGRGGYGQRASQARGPPPIGAENVFRLTKSGGSSTQDPSQPLL